LVCMEYRKRTSRPYPKVWKYSRPHSAVVLHRQALPANTSEEKEVKKMDIPAVTAEEKMEGGLL
jgi:hypothetical protein